ncbi:hypothetical protein BGZ83_005106 [Gryganskiella cystojenkinii]|nr:hypothetical protein BGZ83_005106 [Gryganskiella cystojenkinii]
MSDSEMADFLNCCPPLKVLRMNNSGFWYRSLDALETRGHVRSLETLSLRCSPDVQPWMVQWILCCSPRLRSLQCDYMAAHEMVQDITEEKVDTETESSLLVMSAREAQRRQSEVDRAADLKKITQEIEQHQHRFPSELNAIMHRYNSRRQRHLDRVRSWVCLDLECLETIIWFENDNARSVVEKDSATSPLFETATAGQGQGQYQRARIGPTIWDVQVLNQLAQLKSLKRLVLSQYRVMDQNRQRGIRLKLPYLGHLSTLTSLQRLTLSATKSGNMDHILDELEVRWMMEHWPRIKAIASRFRVQAGYSEILSAEEKIREDGRIRDELSQLAGSRGIQLYLWKPF